MAKFFRRTFSTLKALRITMNAQELPEIFLPPINRSMTNLDRSFFKKTIPISVASVADPKQIAKVRGVVTRSHEMLYLSGIKPIVEDDQEKGAKCILLKPEVKADQPETWSAQLSELVNDDVVRVRPYNLTLTYDNWTMNNILEAILPELPEDQKETPAGFAQAGHVAHVNLRSQYLPYKNLIAQVLLDKNTSIRTVINKTLDVGTESEFRTFPYEVLAGDNDLEVTVSEQDCEFHFNFAEVYWNSRLHTEHGRVVAKFREGEAVCDVMAGVGPFAIPAGKKKVFVRANDLNPHSYNGLLWAINKNKVDNFVSAECMDGREFIKKSTTQLARYPRTFEKAPKQKIPRHAPLAIMEEIVRKRLQNTVVYREPTVFDHYVMNLPATAVEFLDAFVGLYQGREIEFMPHTSRKLPMIHVWMFQTKLESEDDEINEVCERVSKCIGAPVRPTDQDIEIFDARLVAPKKKYYRVSFRIPAEVAFAQVKQRRASQNSNHARSRSPSRERLHHT